MPRPFSKTTILTLVALCAAVLIAGGCILRSDGTFQTLILFFELDEEIPEGEAFLAHAAVFPNEVKLRKQWVRISGRIEPSPEEFAAEMADEEGEEDPPAMATRVMVEAIGEEIPPEDATDEEKENPKRDHKFANRVSIDDDGTFEAIKKFRSNIGAGVIQEITIEALNGLIPAGARIALCVDVADKKKDFNDDNSCAASEDDAPNGGEADHTVRVLDFEFDPKQLTIEPGDTVRWVLRGEDSTHTVTAMSGAFDSGFVFTEEGADFLRTFPQSENGETFEYFCVTHQAVFGMQGSVRVGADAAPPMDGY